MCKMQQNGVHKGMQAQMLGRQAHQALSQRWGCVFCVYWGTLGMQERTGMHRLTIAFPSTACLAAPLGDGR